MSAEKETGTHSQVTYSTCFSPGVTAGHQESSVTAALPEPAIAVSDSRKSSFAEGGKGTMWLHRKKQVASHGNSKNLTLLSYPRFLLKGKALKLRGEERSWLRGEC